MGSNKLEPEEEIDFLISEDNLFVYFCFEQKERDQISNKIKKILKYATIKSDGNFGRIIKWYDAEGDDRCSTTYHVVLIDALKYYEKGYESEDILPVVWAEYFINNITDIDKIKKAKGMMKFAIITRSEDGRYDLDVTSGTKEDFKEWFKEQLLISKFNDKASIKYLLSGSINNVFISAIETLKEAHNMILLDLRNI
ncbi:MAG: hypothetical protein QM504_03785 [Pseudomonadota bacterium]